MKMYCCCIVIQKNMIVDDDSINKYCRENYGLCHGIRIAKDRYGRTHKGWSLFGCEDEDYTVGLYYYDFQCLNSVSSPYYRDIGIKRPCWGLYKRGVKKIFRTWRRLPKRYIDFKKLMET